MAKGYLDKFINWLAKLRYTNTVSNFMIGYGTGFSSLVASLSSGEMSERCGIMSFNAVLILEQSVTISSTGSVSSPSPPFRLAYMKSGFRPKHPVPFVSRGQSFQFFGYIDTDGSVMVSGGQARGTQYTINSGYQVRIGGTYVIGDSVTAEQI